MKKRIALSVLGVILLALIAMAVFSKRAPDHPYYLSDLPYPLVIAHQGGDGLWPGDTLYAYEHAAELGVDVLEMDLHITSDGVLVINHDETVDRTTDGTGEIEKMTLAEIQALDAGYDIPLSRHGHHHSDAGRNLPDLSQLSYDHRDQDD